MRPPPVFSNTASIPKAPGSAHIPRELFLNAVALVTCLPVLSPKAAWSSPMLPAPETLVCLHFPSSLLKATFSTHADPH